MIKLINKHHKSPLSQNATRVYIGRGSVLGNPYTSISDRETRAEFICESREESVLKYREHLEGKISSKDPKICKELNRLFKIAKVGNLELECFCSPKLCHGNVIMDVLGQKLGVGFGPIVNEVLEEGALRAKQEESEQLELFKEISNEIKGRVGMRRTYEGKIVKLEKNQIFVFGSNFESRHGKGAALFAKQKCGAIQGHQPPTGFQGRSYAIVTKDLQKRVHPSVSEKNITEQIADLYSIASSDEWDGHEFLVPYNCSTENLNSYTADDMARMFVNAAGEDGMIPENIVFEKGFLKLMCQMWVNDV